MNLPEDLIERFALCTKRAAYGAYKLKGKGDKVGADQLAVDEMRSELNKINMKGKIVIGEGEMDKAPMLYIGESVGKGNGDELDIAVDPLEGTNFAARNLPNALSVIAVSKKGNLLNAPDMYMEKIAIGSGYPKDIVDLDHSVEKNIKLIADFKSVTPDKLTVCVLERPRHKEIVEQLNSLGVKIKFISDGDVAGVLSVSDKKTGVDIYLGIGGGPEGVLAAAALNCLGCQMQTRLFFSNDSEKERSLKMGIKDLNKKYSIDEMVKGDVIFSASGVTDGEILSGIREEGDFFYAETLVLHKNSKTNKIFKKKIKK